MMDKTDISDVLHSIRLRIGGIEDRLLKFDDELAIRTQLRQDMNIFKQAIFALEEYKQLASEDVS